MTTVMFKNSQNCEFNIILIQFISKMSLVTDDFFFALKQFFKFK